MRKEYVDMEAIISKESVDGKRQLEELLGELDKGIYDMEQGRVLPCAEAVKQIKEELGLCDV